MPDYEYKSTINGETHLFDYRLTEEEMAEKSLKRVWSGAFVWPQNQRGH